MSHVWPCARPERRAARRGSRARAKAEARVDLARELVGRRGVRSRALINSYIYLCAKENGPAALFTGPQHTLYRRYTRGEPVVTGVPRV